MIASPRYVRGEDLTRRARADISAGVAAGRFDVPDLNSPDGRGRGALLWLLQLLDTDPERMMGRHQTA